jgi:hypothetical protein
VMADLPWDRIVSAGESMAVVLAVLGLVIVVERIWLGRWF